MSTPILYVMTDNSAVGVPSTDEVNPLLGYKNPNGVGAFLLSGLVVNTSTGPELLQTRTDSQFVAGETLNTTRPVLPVRSTLFAYDAVANGMVPVSALFPGDAQTDLFNLLGVASWPLLFNGVTYDQARELSASNLATFLGSGGQIAGSPGEWAIQHTPAAATQATITRAAGGAGVRHVCKSITCSILATAAQGQIIVNLRDGATGAGTILWSAQFLLAAGTSDRITISGLNIVGSANTAMTLETAAAPAATNFASVSLTGYDAS